MSKPHPEVFRDILTEFKRLHDKQPSVNGTLKWSMATRIVRDLAIADTYLIKQELGVL